MAKKQEVKSFEDILMEELGPFKAKLVKDKLKDNNLIKLIAGLLVEWACGRVKL